VQDAQAYKVAFARLRLAAAEVPVELSAPRATRSALYPIINLVSLSRPGSPYTFVDEFKRRHEQTAPERLEWKHTVRGAVA
jgi:hypothetical protein